MKLKHTRKRTMKNSLFRVVNELNGKMYPMGMKEEMKYIENLYLALGRRYSKIAIAKLLRRIMSYAILSKTPACNTPILVARKVVRDISEKDFEKIYMYITTNNQHIANLEQSRVMKQTEN